MHSNSIYAYIYLNFRYIYYRGKSMQHIKYSCIRGLKMEKMSKQILALEPEGGLLNSK